MTNLMMRVQRSAPFGSIDEAREPVAALARELGAANMLRRMWTLFRGVILPLDLETIELLLTRGRWIRAGRPGQPTHVIPLNSLPAGPGEIGQISLTARPAADALVKQMIGVGLHLSVRLSDESFTSDADALICLIGACFDTALANTTALGPCAWVKELGTGWATATRRTDRDGLPSGATVVPTRTGSIIIAHREEPGSTSMSARDAVVRVHHALNGMSAQTSTPVARTDPFPMTRQESISSHVAPIPSPIPSLASAKPPAPVPPAFRQASDLAGTMSLATLPIPDLPLAAPLPFGIMPSSEFVASLSAVRPTTPHSEVGETLPLGANLLSAMLPSLPFNHAGSALPPMAAKPAPLPQLTLDAYASLCAELWVFPSRAADILRKYGVVDDVMRRELDHRWGDLFTTVPLLREEWQRKVTSFGDWLRCGGR